ncbi:MAG: hypothetical protein JNK33_04785 [Candidatus Doudnabacteria bacterium]|nr:hypothetical protein [Candidatus Doudnabacteria bacterium]
MSAFASEQRSVETGKFSEKERAQFLFGLKGETAGAFGHIDLGDFLRFAGVPNHLIIDEINAVPVNERLARAVELGLLASPEGYSWSFTGLRPVVFVKVGGQMVPFYRSSKGTGGVKTAGVWYPFFGLGEGEWLIKGGGDNFETSYNNSALQKVQAVLNAALNWDHDLDLKGMDADGYPLRDLESFCPPGELNQLLYGQKDLPYHPNRHDGKSGERITRIIMSMYEKYPVEVVKGVVDANRAKLAELGYSQS